MQNFEMLIAYFLFLASFYIIDKRYKSLFEYVGTNNGSVVLQFITTGILFILFLFFGWIFFFPMVFLFLVLMSGSFLFYRKRFYKIYFTNLTLLILGLGFFSFASPNAMKRSFLLLSGYSYEKYNRDADSESFLDEYIYETSNSFINDFVNDYLYLTWVVFAYLTFHIFVYSSSRLVKKHIDSDRKNI